jgi:hypothetical protein
MSVTVTKENDAWGVDPPEDPDYLGELMPPEVPIDPPLIIVPHSTPNQVFGKFRMICEAYTERITAIKAKNPAYKQYGTEAHLEALLCLKKELIRLRDITQPIRKFLCRRRPTQVKYKSSYKYKKGFFLLHDTIRRTTQLIKFFEHPVVRWESDHLWIFCTNQRLDWKAEKAKYKFFVGADPDSDQATKAEVWIDYPRTIGPKPKPVCQTFDLAILDCCHQLEKMPPDRLPPWEDDMELFSAGWYWCWTRGPSDPDYGPDTRPGSGNYFYQM